MSSLKGGGAAAPMLRIVTVFAVALALCFGAAPSAQETPESEARSPKSLDDFVIQGYVASGAYSPDALIAMDNNARLLFECREGRSAEELRSTGIEFADSQLELLVATNLLFRDSLGDLYTTFPILDVEAAQRIRDEASDLADALSATVESEARALAGALEASGHSSHGYSVFFSYVLDGMAWGFFEEYRKVPRRVLSARRPFWAGEIWAIRPERSFWAQTRSIASDGLTLKVTSGPGSAGADELLADPTLLKQALAQASSPNRSKEGVVPNLLIRRALVDPEGRWTIPVIDEIKKDPVFRAAEVLTSNLVDAVLETLDLEGFRERYPFRTPQQALVIVYHELMWELIDRFEAMGVVSRPDGLERPESANQVEQSVAAGTTFLVDRRFPEPDRQDVLEPQQDALEEAESGSGE